MVTFLFSICPNIFSFVFFEPMLHLWQVFCRKAANLFVYQRVNGGDGSRMTTALWGNSGAVCVTSEEAPFSHKWPAR